MFFFGAQIWHAANSICRISATKFGLNFVDEIEQQFFCQTLCDVVFNFAWRTKFGDFKRKLWSSGRALGSRSEGLGIDPCPMLGGSGVKAMPGSIPTPNSGSL